MSIIDPSFNPAGSFVLILDDPCVLKWNKTI